MSSSGQRFNQGNSQRGGTEDAVTHKSARRNRRALEEIYEAENARLAWIVRAFGEVLDFLFRRRSYFAQHTWIAENARSSEAGLD